MTRSLLLLALFLVPAFAQNEPKAEVFGFLGAGKTYDDEGSLGSGVHGGGGIGYRLAGRFGVEAEVNAFRTRREFSFTPIAFQASGAFVMGNGLLFLKRGRSQIYLIGGAGLLHVENQYGFAGVPVNRSANGFAIDLGVGMKIYATRHLVVRPDLRIFAGDSGQTIEAPFSTIRFALGVGYCW